MFENSVELTVPPSVNMSHTGGPGFDRSALLRLTAFVSLSLSLSTSKWQVTAEKRSKMKCLNFEPTTKERLCDKNQILQIVFYLFSSRLLSNLDRTNSASLSGGRQAGMQRANFILSIHSADGCLPPNSIHQTRLVGRPELGWLARSSCSAACRQKEPVLNLKLRF